MVASPQIGRKLTYKRQERRVLHKLVRQAAQSVPAAPTTEPPTLTPAEIMAQWNANGVIGGWAHRKDIGDSAEYARLLRAKAERRE